LSKQIRLASLRAGQGFREYLASFGPGEWPLDVQRATFEFLRGRLAVEFPVLASDDIERVYGIAGDDLHDAVMSVAYACKRNPVLDEQAILTVRDLVSVVGRFPARLTA
jgi:hypothetical protein